MDLMRDKGVLLFYKDFERDTFFKHDRYLKRLVRPIYHRFSAGPKVSGFFVWYQLLVTALRRAGYDVRLNDYATARRNPDYPVGLVGYPHLIDDWRLPNPAVLGPSLFDHPQNRPHLMDDPRFRRYIVTCQWMQDMFAPVYGDACVRWYAGMDVEQWADTRGQPKDIDVLIYDKIRWNRDRYVPELRDPIVRELDARGLRHTTVRYGQYDHATYHALLSRSKALLFLCEHETQGMAYQEALASNVPVLAWDNGFWLDPNRPRFDPNPVPASSVPFFGPECGERFRDITGFAPTFERFWSKLDTYQPREWVRRNLSMQGSAELYMEHYTAVAEEVAHA